MPPRPIFLVIVAFWLGTAVWFFDRDVWPALRPGDAPPYTIELADEARHMPAVTWELSRNGKPAGTVSTTIRYEAKDDTFELSAQSVELVVWRHPLAEITARNVKDQVRVNRE